MTYDLSGNFHEACDCEVICSCSAEVEPVKGQCTGIFVWEITADIPAAGEVSLAGCKLSTISHGASCDEADQMLVLIDSRDATGAQDIAKQTRLQTVFGGPGPWNAVIATTTDTDRQFIEGEITLPAEPAGSSVTLQIGLPAIANPAAAWHAGDTSFTARACHRANAAYRRGRACHLADRSGRNGGFRAGYPRRSVCRTAFSDRSPNRPTGLSLRSRCHLGHRDAGPVHYVQP